jgi:hypothetical protein
MSYNGKNTNITSHRTLFAIACGNKNEGGFVKESLILKEIPA